MAKREDISVRLRYNFPMPFVLAHTSLGKDVRAALGQPLPHDDEPLYYLGCLGPDVYFFDAFPPTPFTRHQMQLGKRLHNEDAAGLFSALLSHADARHTPFLCGMLCHLALDAAVHPYVTACTRDFDHTRFEIAIDMRMFPRQTRAVGLPFALQREADAAVADALMSAVAGELFGVSVAGAYRRGFRKLGSIVLPLLYDPTGGKRRFVTAAERAVRRENALSGFLLTEGRPDEADVCNLDHRPWAAPNAPDRIRHEDVPALYQSACAHAKALITAYLDGGREALLPLVAGYTMSRGAPVTPL